MKGGIMNNTRRIQTFIGTMLLIGLGASAYASAISHTWHGYLTVAVMALAAATSRMKVKLPGIDGNMSVNLPFLLTAAVNLSSAEAVAITCISTAVQCWPRNNAKFNPQQMTFNLSMTAFATSAASLAFHAVSQSSALGHSTTLGLVLATTTLFLGQTTPVAGIVAASEGKSAWSVWTNLGQLSFPYFVVGAGVTSLVEAMSLHLGWGLALGVFPAMYVIHRSYKLYFKAMAESLRPEVLVRAAGAGA
jgi:hypothetical protein